jgi:ribosomal protein S25
MNMTAGKPQPGNPPSDTDHACNRKHGTVEDLLSLIPAPAPTKANGDPFVCLSPRAAKAWLALFAHAQEHGTWQPSQVNPMQPELSEEKQFILTAHWTVHGLGYAMGVNRDTAGKALQELADGGWIRRESSRIKGQFGGIEYSFTIPSSVTQADKSKVAKALKKRGVEYRDYEFRTAARILDNKEIKRVQQDVELEIATEQADLDGDEEKAVELVSQQVLRYRMPEEEEQPCPVQLQEKPLAS